MRALKPLLIVLPVYEDRACLRRLLCDIAALKLPSIRLLIVDDGSIHAPPRSEDITDAGFSGEIIRLQQNVGHQMAIAVGLKYAARHYPNYCVLVMDADGEDPADAIPRLIRCFKSSAVDVAVARRGHRHNSWVFQLCYRFYLLLFLLLTGRHISFGNYMLLSAGGVGRLSGMASLSVHFPATVLASGLVLSALPVDRGRRYVGVSRMSFAALVAHGICSMKVFAGAVFVRLAGCATGFAIASLALATLLRILEQRGLAIPGWMHSAEEALIAGFVCGVGLVIASIVAANTTASGSTMRAVWAAKLIERALIGNPARARNATS
jgi:glycosyltransferase involved in cell wall biosynthesis